MGVQINGSEGNVIATKGTFSGDVGIGGTLTYEDVTNIDSVGLITARSGIKVTSGDIAMDTAGNITLGDSGGATDDRIAVGAGGDIHIYHDGTDSYVSNATGDLKLFSVGGSADDVIIRAQDDIELQPNNGEAGIKVIGDGAVELYHDNSLRLATDANGIHVTTNIHLNDNGVIEVGTGSDLTIQHDGSNTRLKNDTGQLQLRSNAIVFENAAGSSFADIQSHFRMIDSKKIHLGSDTDASVYHDGSNAYITNDTGYLYVQSDNFSVAAKSAGENMIVPNKDGAVHLYYDSVLQFSTTSDGLILNTGARISRTANSNNTIMEVTNAQYAKSIYFGGWDNGSNDAGIARVRNSNDNLHIDAGSAGITYINAYCTGATFIRDLWPLNNDTFDLGRNSEKWDDIYATNGTIQTSDKNQKNTIIESDLGLSFVNKLKPVSYKFNGKTRTHYGLIAQDVETVLSDISKSTTDFAGFIKTDLPDEYYQEAEPHIPDGKKEGDLKSAAHSEYGLRYGEFISPLIKAVQELSAENTALKARLDAAGL